jgi:hypothetical protein
MESLHVLPIVKLSGLQDPMQVHGESARVAYIQAK